MAQTKESIVHVSSAESVDILKNYFAMNYYFRQ